MTLRYPYEVFVATAALEDARERDKWSPCYQLLKVEDQWISRDWRCSHFYTQGDCVLNYHGTSREEGNPHTRVTLQCSEQPIAMGDTHQQAVTFMDSDDNDIPMKYKIEVSGYQISKRNPNPMKVTIGNEGYQWCSKVEFSGQVFGQRLGDKVWLETPYDLQVTISPTRASA